MNVVHLELQEQWWANGLSYTHYLRTHADNGIHDYYETDIICIELRKQTNLQSLVQLFY